jgi:glycosyltransferase involved in cell wall biosynthesis
MSTAKDLSILIPSRNEMFLQKTIETVLAATEADTEIIAVADGAWPDPPVKDHPRVILVHHSESIGQRAATNEAARISRARFVMKLDAHCAVDQGFDRKLIAAYDSGELAPDVTTVPAMYNLHGFDWECTACKNRLYQGPKPVKCEKCGHREHEMAVVFKPRMNRLTTAWRFDHTLHFQYWREGEKRQKGELCDILCCLGACFMMTRERYWELGGMDEAHGSWGQMGVEVGCKSWLSGGRMVVNKRTWFSHMFRTQQGFSFPYPAPNPKPAREHSRKLWIDGAWPKAVRTLDWLLDHFKPLPDWHEDRHYLNQIDGDLIKGAVHLGPALRPGIKKGLVYYTDNRLDERLMAACQARLNRYRNGWDLVSVSLQPMAFGRNIHLPLERGHLAMFKQILAGLEAVDADVVYLVEHDMLYHRSHFDFVPPKKDVYYYNENTWKVDAATGQALFYYCKQTSGLVAWRELLIEHYRKRVAKVEAEGYDRNMGYEPGTHRPPRGVDSHPAERFMSKHPNIDIRHGSNWTRSRWRQDQFRNKNACLGWQMADEVPGWGKTKGRFDEFLMEVLP